MSSHTPNQTSRQRRVRPNLGVVLVGHLSVSVSLLPWLSLSAHGQAALLETNPAPDTPTFAIPTEVAPAPEPAVSPLSTQPEASAAPIQEYAPAPEPPQAYEPEPYIEPELDGEPDPYFEPAPYVEAPISTPTAETPAYIPSEPEVAGSLPPGGCAALLDPSLAPGTGCPSTAPEITTAPIPPQQTAPAILANEESAPPARQMRPAVAATVPPARRVATSVSPLSQNTDTSIQPVIPTYSAVVASAQAYGTIVPPAPMVYSAVPNRDIAIPPEWENIPNTPPHFTVVKPNRYRLKPIGKSPMPWIFGDRAMLFPLPFPVAVSSAFGWRQHPIQNSWHLHAGVDFAAPQGTPVVAAYDGTVKVANYVQGYGLSVLLNHQDGERQTRYAHLAELYVKPGQKVSQGDVLGAVGSTGNSTGPHLHFETLVKTPQGMVVADPTPVVKVALMKALEKNALAKQNSSRTPTTLSTTSAPQSAPQSEITPPIPVEVVKPMTQYQASASQSQPYFEE